MQGMVNIQTCLCIDQPFSYYIFVSFPYPKSSQLIKWFGVLYPNADKPPSMFSVILLNSYPMHNCQFHEIATLINIENSVCIGFSMFYAMASIYENSYI
jgi:hypothetical protein